MKMARRERQRRERQRRPLPLLSTSGLALLLVASFTAACSPAPPPLPPQTVVLVTIDTLRADGVSYSVDVRGRTPFLDELAGEGIAYAHAYAPASWTAPSMASLFTGYEPASHGVVSGSVGRPSGADDHGTTVRNQPLLPQSFTTLAEVFQSAGYTTIGVAANLHLATPLGFGQGFDHYYDEAAFLIAPDVNALVLAKLEEAFGAEWKTTWKQERVFLWVHYFDPHIPYEAREPWINDFAPEFATHPEAYPAGWNLPELMEAHPEPDLEIASRLVPLYRSENRYIDHHLRALDAELGFRDDDVLLVVTSDHGEEFVEHGGFGHGQTLFEESIRVPLFLRWPRAFPAALRVGTPVSLLDVYPTLAELAGLTWPSEMQGLALPEVTGASAGDRKPMYFHTDRARPPLHGVIDGSWKMIRAQGQASRLYDLAGDPHETVDVAAEHPEVVRALEIALSLHLSALPAPPDDTGFVPVEDVGNIDQLRKMGYGE